MNNELIETLAHQLLELDQGTLRPREKAVIGRIVRRLAVSQNVNAEFDATTTTGEKLADRVASVGGSWAFIISFCALIALWALLNTLILASDAFDPYPFIFLNLVLSLLAAIQAPVIMMSQNRQADRDRLAANQDYEVNLKSEIEIAALHEKIDRIKNEDLARLLTEVEGLIAKLPPVKA
jgi:uncharacterized membrane protein